MTYNKVTTTTVVTVGLATAIAYFIYRRRKDRKEEEGKQEKVEVEERKGKTVEEEEKTKKSETCIETSVVAEIVTPAPVKAIEKVSAPPASAPKVEKVPTPVSSSVTATTKKSATYVELYNLAKKLFNAQKFEEALEQFNLAIDASPSNNSQLKTLIYSRASCLKKLNRLEEALAEYTKCIELDAKYSRAYKARAAIEVSLDQVETALSDYSYNYMLEMVAQGDMQPTSEEMDQAIQILAKREVDEEKKQHAIDPTYKRSLPSKQFVSFYFSTINSEKSEAYNTEALTIDELTRRIDGFPVEGESKTKGDLLLMRGGQEKSERKYAAAFIDFMNASEEENGCTQRHAALLEKGTFLALSGDVSSAHSIYEKLYEGGDRSVNLLIKYASCLLEQEQPHHALFDEAVTSNVEEIDGYFHRGQMYFLENKSELAMTDLLKATHLQPTFPIAHVQLAYCYMQMGNMNGAITSMKRALSCGRNKAQVYNHFGELYMTMGRVAEAEENYKKAQSEDPHWAYSYVNQAILVLQAQQDYLTAGNLLKKAIAVDHTCVTAYLQMAQLHMLLQEWDQAKETVEQALKESRTDNDMQQVCTMRVTAKYQLEAMEKYQTSLKNTI